MDRDQLIAKLQKSYPTMNCMLTEDFFGGGSEGGVWLSAEDDIVDRKGNQLFNYYNTDNANREFGVIYHLNNFVNRNGWFFEWNDAGTIMIWQD